MRVPSFFLAIVAVFLATCALASTPLKLRHLEGRRPAQREILSTVVELGHQRRINKADSRAHKAIVRGDMKANAHYLARGDELRKQGKNVIPAIRLGESAATGNIPGAVAAGAQLAQNHYKRKADKAAAAHAAAGKSGPSQAAIDANKKSNAARKVKTVANVVDTVASGAGAVNGLAKGAVNVGNVAGAASAGAAGVMGAVGLAKKANAMGLKTNVQKAWGNTRTAVKMKGQVMPASGNKPAPVAKVPRAPSAALDKAGLTTSKGKKLVNAVKACVGKCVRAVGKASDKIQGHS